MKSPLALSLVFLFLCHRPTIADEARLAKVTAADEARIAAMLSTDTEKLTALLSEDLHYAHSNGVVDTRDQFIANLLAGTTKYVGYDHVERSFTFPTPGIALMSGRTRIHAATAKGAVDSVLSYLSVWREENGQWRFLAWQSCRLPVETKP